MKLLSYCSILVVLILVISCDKETPENPFENFIPNQDTVTFELLNPEPNSIAGIYANIFKPTCANVGCHDGTFEPDFRTLESAYNTLIYQIPIKNDGNYTYRVHPGDPSKSAIMARLNGQLLPYMPIQLEPDSDWVLNRDKYIENIRTWISNGARDIAGNLPGQSQATAKLAGVFAMNTDTILKREPNQGPIRVFTEQDSLDIYFAFRHDAFDPANFSEHRVAFSEGFNGFQDPLLQLNLRKLVNPVFERGFYNQVVKYTHAVTVGRSALLDQHEKIFFRAYVKDAANPLTEIPTDHGIFNIKNYMSLVRKD
jgi:hypothetical protein